MECVKPLDALHAAFVLATSTGTNSAGGGGGDNGGRVFCYHSFYAGVSNTATVEINNAVIGSRCVRSLIAVPNVVCSTIVQGWKNR